MISTPPAPQQHDTLWTLTLSIRSLSGTWTQLSWTGTEAQLTVKSRGLKPGAWTLTAPRQAPTWCVLATYSADSSGDPWTMVRERFATGFLTRETAAEYMLDTGARLGAEFPGWLETCLDSEGADRETAHLSAAL